MDAVCRFSADLVTIALSALRSQPSRDTGRTAAGRAGSSQQQAYSERICCQATMKHEAEGTTVDHRGGGYYSGRL